MNRTAAALIGPCISATGRSRRRSSSSWARETRTRSIGTDGLMPTALGGVHGQQELHRGSSSRRAQTSRPSEDLGICGTAGDMAAEFRTMRTWNAVVEELGFQGRWNEGAQAAQ